MAERDGYDKPPYKVDVEYFPVWAKFFMAFLMKYDGAHETIQVIIPAVESAENTEARLATNEKGNNVTYSYLCPSVYI